MHEKYVLAEPIYMNTQELAKKIAEKKQQENSGQQQATLNFNGTPKAPTTELEEREVIVKKASIFHAVSVKYWGYEGSVIAVLFPGVNWLCWVLGTQLYPSMS